MSDFVSDFWNFYVSGIVVLSLIACVLLLWSQHSVTYTVGKTTGHSWDGNLEEFNNPLPKWWSGLFYLTLVFAVVYLVLFPGVGSFPGLLGWTSAGQHADEVKAADAVLQPRLNVYLQQDIKAVSADPTARAMGERMFKSYCIQCHGVNGEGKQGQKQAFPNLVSGNWQWGAAPENIKETIMEGRMGIMTPHPDFSDAALDDLANYVLSLSGRNADTASASRGRQLFLSSDCTTCHGVDAKGNTMLGAPNLTNDRWLYGSDKETIKHGIKEGRQNRMPTWKNFLGEGKVHLLAAYVYSLQKK